MALTDGQIGFYTFVWTPMFNLIANWFGSFDDAAAQFQLNLQRWQAMAVAAF
jgi:hypothetical protein